jgi:glycine/D-amino acid oxidase-like deaminating enzyme
MGTVILGGGIIGLSTAYYLSQARPPSNPDNPPIHIVDSSHALLLSASGYAGGFLAEDWFSPASASLGKLSFGLHRELAKEHDGFHRWGYSGTHTYSLSMDGTGIAKPDSPIEDPKSEDWINTRHSRAGVAPGNPQPDNELGAEATSNPPQEPLNPDGSPACFTSQPGGTLSTLATRQTTANIDPAALCRFLLRDCCSRGVQLHLSATPTAVTLSRDKVLTGLTYTTTKDGTDSTQTMTVPCTALILAAGAWTPSLFKTLFPSSRTRLPISALAGYSIVLHSPRYRVPHTVREDTIHSPGDNNATTCYAIYASPHQPPQTGSKSQGWDFAWEVFARLRGDEEQEPNASNSRTEIWFGGLNTETLRLPSRAEKVAGLAEQGMKRELRRVARLVCGLEKDAAGVLVEKGDGSVQREGGNEASSTDRKADDDRVALEDLTIVREGLCFRPVSRTGVPVIVRLSTAQLGGVRVDEGGGGGVFVASGHGPWGISLSLGTGLVVSEMVLGREVSADVGGLGL